MSRAAAPLAARLRIIVPRSYDPRNICGGSAASGTAGGSVTRLRNADNRADDDDVDPRDVFF